MNAYKVEIEISGTTRRTIVAADTRGQAYRFVTDAFPTCEILSIVSVK